MSKRKTRTFTGTFRWTSGTVSGKDKVPSVDISTNMTPMSGKTKSSSSMFPFSQMNPLSDEEILRGIRYVETITGRKSGGKVGGYHEYRDDTGVYGAYQIKPAIWGPEIKNKFGWDLEDWFDEDPESERRGLMKHRQDEIASKLILPDHKKQVASAHLYETRLGKHLPKGTLEMLSQLGVGNLQKFLTEGKDNTAFNKVKGGQIMKYLETSLALFGKEVPSSFTDELEAMGGVKTKYNNKLAME